MNFYYFFLFLQFILIALFFLFATHRYYIIYLYRKNYKQKQYQWPHNKPLPYITVQVPMYNEFNVAKRVIDAVCALDYPNHLLEIQILDDSSDTSKEVIYQHVLHWKKEGIDIHHIHRKNRKGFKAGALEEGLHQAKGSFVAVFDADFVPKPDILHKLLAPFANKEIGMVQARWDHLNTDYSMLTELQALFLDSHFVLEQTARNTSGRFINFNGTAGMWRKETINQAGGWQHDTLTEDLDLSYRAQLKGWKFVYLPNITCEAELPVNMNAFKSQQHRWGKGAIQTGLKLLPSIMKSDLSLKVKIESLFHLFANISYPMTLLLALSWLPNVYIGIKYDIIINHAFGFILFFLSTLPFIIFFLYSQKAAQKNWWKKIIYIPWLLILGIGLAVNNGIAILEAFAHKQSEFVRTPKYAIRKKTDTWKKSQYSLVKNKIFLIELGLAAYMGITLFFAVSNGFWGSIPFILLFFLSFLYIGSVSFFHMLKVK